MAILMPFFYDAVMRRPEEACLRAWRRELLADLEGDVLELGAGTGANLALYPPTVRRLVVLDEDDAMLARLRARLPGATPREVEVVQASAAAIPLPDASFDVVVATLLLCSVRDVGAVLGEVRRVLRPGGAFVFLEHVAAEEGSRLRWQRRIEPLWRLLAGNCHLTRRTAEAIAAAGFVLESPRRESMRRAPPFVRPTVRGVARVPG